MTLPASFPLSVSQIAAELGASLPLSLIDAKVLALAGKSGAPISFSDLLGKTAAYKGTVATVDNGGFPDTWQINLGNAPWLGGTLSSVVEEYNFGYFATLFFNTAPTTWRGNILVSNNSTEVSAVFTYAPASGGTQWTCNPLSNGNLIVVGHTDSYTILPSL